MIHDPISLAAWQGRRDAIFQRNFVTWSTMAPAAWAESVRRMPDKHGASRPFSFDYAPYQREMFAELFNPANQEVVFQLFSRGGKSEVVLNALGYFIGEVPKEIFVMWPTLGQGKKWSKDNLMRELVDPTPALSRILENAAGKRKSNNTLLHKIYPGGLLDIVGANSPGDIRRAKGNVLYADEIDAIVEIKSDEGDQLKQFKGRGDEFADTREFYCSYPSLKGHSKIEAKELQTDGRRWMVPCLKCGFDQWIMTRTRDLRYEKDNPAGARLECPNCHEFHDDDARYKMSRLPEKWTPTREATGKVGFQANALLWPHPVDRQKYPGGFLHLLAQEELDVENSDNPERSRRVMVNRRDAETYQAASDAKPDHSALFLRREEYDPSNKLPAGVLAIEVFVDVQFDRLEVFVQGFGLNKQEWDLDYRIIKGGKGAPLAKPDEGVWAELDKFLLTATYAHPCGKNLRIRVTLIDAGNWRDNVFDFTRPRAGRRIFASRGDTELSRPILEKRARKEGKYKTRVWVIGTHAAKEIIYQRLDQTDPRSTGFRHYPKLGQFSEHYFKMLTAEDSEDRQGRDGQWHKWFGCEKGVRNEALDGAVGCMAAEKIDRPNYQKLSEELAVTKEGKPSARKTPKEPAPADPSPRNNFATKGTARPGKSLLRRPAAKPGAVNVGKKYIRKIR